MEKTTSDIGHVFTEFFGQQINTVFGQDTEQLDFRFNRAVFPKSKSSVPRFHIPVKIIESGRVEVPVFPEPGGAGHVR